MLPIPFAGNRRAAAMLLLALLSGCSLVPQYHAPPLPVADHWNAGAPLAAAAGGQWWQAFGSAELDALISRGLSQNYDLQAALSRLDEARSSAQVAGAAQFPLLSLNGLQQRQNNYGTTEKKSVFAEASYEVDFWGKHRAVAKSADALANATAFDAQTLRMTLSADIANSYLQVLSLDERLKLARSIAADAQQVLELVQVQASQGAVSNLEVAQQRNALQTFQAAVPTLQQQRDQALYQLAVLVGAQPQGFSLRGGPLQQVRSPQPSAGLPIGLLRQRPDIQAAEARLQAANFDVGAARAAFLPNLSLDLIGGVDTLAGGTIWSLVGSLSQPLFSGGQLSGQLHYDQAHFRELSASYRQAILLGLEDVETQLSATRELDKHYALSQAAVDSAREAARLAQVRYRLGSTDFQTLLVVERTQYQAEDSLLQVRLLHLQAAVGLFRALGGDFDAQAIASSSSVRAAH